MGNVAFTTPRVVLQDDVQLHFKAAQITEVEEIVRGWFEDGAPLGLSHEAFKRILNLHGDVQEFFKRFDTDGNKKVDAFEVLSAYIVLSGGAIDAKVDLLFPVFDFSSSGRMNFDEINILAHSTYRGLQKVCGTPVVEDTVIIEMCRQMFDSHNLPYEKSVSKEQFKRWLKSDIEATKFVDMFHSGYSLPDIEASLAQREQSQAAIYSQLCNVGSSVPIQALLGSDQLRRTLEDPPFDLYEGLVRMMASSGSGFSTVSLEQFVEVNHAWNVFNVVDVLKEGSLDSKELQVMMWFQNRRKPTSDDTQKQLLALKLEPEAMITRTAWISANVSASTSGI